MIVHETKRRKVNLSSPMDNAVMTLDAEGQAMAIHFLRDKIYSDKILAVLREYSANAYDEHVKHGVDRPIEITLPTTTDLVVRFRDFGVGLSKDGVFNIFGQYFKSTKNTDNDMIGGLGIGAKSGHAYTDSFTVTSWFEGTKTIYEAVLESSEHTHQTVGKIYELHSEPSDDPSGVEISLTVKQRDVDAFTNKAVDLFKWFKVTPKITKGGGNVTVPKIQKADGLSGDGWYVRRNNYGSSRAVALMGNIPYPINDSVIQNLDDLSSNLLTNQNLVIEFGIGELGIAPSREGLEYTTRTQAAIRNRLRSIVDEIKAQVSKEIESQPNMIMAKAVMSDRLSRLGYKWKNDLKVTYRGHELDSKLTYGLGDKTLYYQSDSGSIDSKSTDGSVTIEPTDLLALFIGRVNSGGVARAVTAFQKHPDKKRIVLWRFETKKLFDEAIAKTDLRPEFFADWESFEKVKRSSGVRAERTVSPHTLLFREGYRYSQKHSWQKPKELQKKAIYVELERWGVKKYPLVGVYELTEFMQLARKLKWIDADTVLYGVRSRGIAQVPDGWVELREFVDQKVQSEPQLQARAYQTNVNSNGPTRLYNDLWSKIPKENLTNTEIITWLKQLDKLYTFEETKLTFEDDQMMGRILGYLNIKTTSKVSADPSTYVEVSNKLLKKYPMIDLFEKCQRFRIQKSHWDELVRYLNLVS